MRGLLTLIAALGVMGLLVACSDSSEETSSASSGAGAGTSSASGGAGAAGTGGSTSATGGGAAAVGYIGVQNMVVNAMDSHIISSVLFSTAPMSDCTREQHDSCVVGVCSSLANLNDLTQVSAGDVSMRNGQDTATLMWDGDSYGNIIADGHFFSGGETISVEATGADIPAFNGSVTAPGNIVVDSTTFTTDISQSTPLAFSWTGTGSGNVEVALTTTRRIDSVLSAHVSIACTVDIADGGLTIPTSALSQLLLTGATNCPGSGCEETTARLTIASAAGTSVDVGGQTISIRASWSASYTGQPPPANAWTVVP